MAQRGVLGDLGSGRAQGRSWGLQPLSLPSQALLK